MNIKSLFPKPRNAAARQLRRELAGYDTPSDIADLMAAVDHQDGSDADLIREILGQNLQHWNRTATTAR